LIGAPGRTAGLVATALLLTACTAGTERSAAPAGSSTPGSSTPSRTTSSAPASTGDQPVADTTSIICEHAIDGFPPTPEFTVVLDAVALPTSPGYSALQGADSGSTPRLFAKTGLLVRAGVESRVELPASVASNVGIGWSGWPAQPSRTVVVPACPDLEGTGWLTFAGGYWADQPLCLPVDVRAGDRQQRVEIGIGTPCPGQAPPPG
jgi:hypothetical protein